jgi:hypothetical protein
MYVLLLESLHRVAGSLSNVEALVFGEQGEGAI